MKIAVTTQDPAAIDAALLAVVLPQGAALPPAAAALDRAAAGALTRAVESGDFTGKRDETALVYPGEGAARRVLLVGAGPSGSIGSAGLRRAAGVAARRAVALGVERLAVVVPPESRNGVAPRDVAQVVVEGAAQGAWTFKELKQPPEDAKPDVQHLAVAAAASEAGDFEAGARVGEAIAAGHRLARTLQMQPGNVCTPGYLAEAAEALARTHKLTVTVLDGAALRAEGMRALLAVAQGSAEDPRLIVLEYRGAGDAAPVALIGKGVTFDAGGISIKPAASMEEMKYDMSGAAAVLGAFEALGRLRPAVNVVGLVPATENLPSGTAVKPGDVIKGHLGKTIEIINTDAEGRLILCDALSYVRRFRPAVVLDAATLTGAVVVALGRAATGILGTDDALVEEVRSAGERAGERCWPLPLWEEYRELIKSDIADVKNTGGRGAGTITAAWFLREFVDGFPWVHLDIAGTAYGDGDVMQAKGPTGVGVRLFTEFVLRRAGG